MTKLRLVLVDGPKAGEEMLLEPGEMVSFGRSEPAKIALSWDTFLSREHFRIGNESKGWKVVDAGSRNGTFLNGQPLTEEAILKDNDLVQAGTTTLRAQFTHPPTPPERLMAILRKEPLPLYAVVDSAVSPDILDILRNTSEPCQSLYEGSQAGQLGDVAPYLAQLTGKDILLESLIYGGWGNAWAIYLNSSAPFQEVRRQLRRFLRVVGEDGTKMYFRYYDPRVLPTWLPTCTREEAAGFFGPIQFFYSENKEPGTVLKFRLGSKGAEKEELSYEEDAAPPDDPE
ncbi:MAG TPA: DUF4123 domain-containing protein [Bryobacteraceae bacterium]|nr:DUF4123 domain-containing protein [Bryobacteraceae bacterium]